MQLPHTDSTFKIRDLRQEALTQSVKGAVQTGTGTIDCPLALDSAY